MKQFLKDFSSNRGALAGSIILTIVALTGVTCSFLFENSPWMMVGQPLLLPIS